MGNLGSGPDRLSMYCPLGVVIQLGPISADCTSSKNPSQSQRCFPSTEKEGPNSKGCSLLPSSWVESFDCTLEGVANLDSAPSVLTGEIAFPYNGETK